MSKIQLITYNEMQYANYHSDIEINNFNNLKSLDNYDINVFDLSNSNIWRNKSKYMDKLQEENKEEKIKKILIMNYERTKEIEKRDNINFMQIELAEKNNTLIIDTKRLLTIYEKLLQGILNKSQVIEYIKSNSGIIDLEKI